MWGCIARFAVKELLIPIAIAVIVELVLDKYRRPKAQIHFVDPKAKKHDNQTGSHTCKQCTEQGIN